MSPELNQLIELQALDLEILRVTERLATIPTEREQIESEFNRFASEFIALKHRFEETTRERRQLELDLAAAEDLHQKYKQDLMRVRNEKEYATALREIDATRKQMSVFETEILKRMEESETLDGQVKVYAPDVERKRTDADSCIRALDKEFEGANALLSSLNERRNHLAESLPRQVFLTYDRVGRLRRGQALAEVRNGICTACRMKVRPKVVSDVRKGDQLITCDNCSRILFFRPETTQPAEIGVSQKSTTE